MSLSSVSSFIYSLGRSGIKPLKNGGFSSLYCVGAAGEMARIYSAVCVYVWVCVWVWVCMLAEQGVVKLPRHYI